MKTTTLLATALVALAALAAAPLAGASDAIDLHTATLRGSAAFPAANGDAKYKIDDGLRDLEVEVQDVNSLIGQRVGLRIDGNLVRTAVVDQFGDARIDMRGANVPVVKTGSLIVIRRGATGTVVATGRFN